MTTKLVKQVTPPLRRVALSGALATMAAAALNAGWLWLTQHKFNVTLNIPQALGSDVYVPAQLTKIVFATLMAGAVGVLGALALAKLVIGPRIWCLAVGFGVGLASLYGALTLPNQNLTQHLSLAMFHAIATFCIVPALAWALDIRHQDLVQADLRYHQHIDAAATPETEPVVPTTATVPPEPLNDTLIVDPTEYLPAEGEDTTR
jgi:Family of unknown function (DUF6069)